MDLYLIRHADAEPLSPGGPSSDAERPLSADGLKQTQVLADSLQKRGIRPELIVSSPLLRARQTAEGLLRGWSASGPEVCTCEHLEPGGRRRKLVRFLRQTGKNAVALVGHEPDLGELAAWLVGSKKAQIAFAKAAVAFISFDDVAGKGGGALKWLVTPDWMTS